MAPSKRIPAHERAERRCVYEERGYLTPCRIFKGALVRGYGVIGRDGKSSGVHRVIWEHYRGPIPDGLQLDHLCRQRDCCELTHLEPVTARENLLRSPITHASVNAAKTHCPRGHAYDTKNTYVSSRGLRHCKACLRDNRRESWRRAHWKNYP